MGAEIYRPLIEDMTWSYSRVTCFDDCRYKFFVRYIKNEKEFPRFYASYGSFMHKLIELFNNGLITQDEAVSEFLTGFSENVKGDRPGASIVDKYIESGMNYLQNMKQYDMKTLGVEKRVKFSVFGNKFIGVIDFIGEKDGEIYIIDNKSRDLKPRSNRKKPTVNDETIDEMLKQLYLYSVAVHDEFGKFPKYLCFNCFKNGEFIKEEFDEKRYEEVLKWAADTIEMIKDENDFYPNVEYFKCANLCGLSDDCIFWQGR